MTGRPSSTKPKIKAKIRKKILIDLQAASATKSKIKYLTDNKIDWRNGTPAPYMQKLNRYEASIIFKTRSRMLEVKNNYKNKYRDLKCRMCNNHEEDQMHALQMCPELPKRGIEPVTMTEIFSENITSLKATAKKINIIMQSIQNPAPTPNLT